MDEGALLELDELDQEFFLSWMKTLLQPDEGSLLQPGSTNISLLFPLIYEALSYSSVSDCDPSAPSLGLLNQKSKKKAR